MYCLQSMLERIKDIKKKKGYTNEHLAAKTDISISTLSKVLAGIIKEPPVTTIIKIAIALDVSADYLIFGKDNNNESVEENTILKKYNLLNTIGKEKTDEYVDDLLENPKYVNKTAEEKENDSCIVAEFEPQINDKNNMKIVANKKSHKANYKKKPKTT